MRYDWNRTLGVAEFSKEYYQEIDRRFFADAERYLPSRTRPFDAIIPFDRLPECDVLEIGVGCGSHAQLIAPHCRSYTGIDLTDYAVTSTTRRFQAFGISGQIRQMDAEQMSLPDNAFDYVWSWGVIHHSADTGRILSEMRRVLRPGGTAGVMVYHRSALYAYVYAGLLHGVLGGGLLKHSLHELLQLNTDGAIARFYRRREWRELAAQRGLVIDDEKIVGQKSEVILFPAGPAKDRLMAWVPDAAARLITNTCRQGSFLITTLRKP